jgi:hypothetical protein
VQDKWRVHLYEGIAAAGKGTAGPNGGPSARGERDAAFPKVLSTSSNGPVRGSVALAAAGVPFVDASALSLNGRGPGGRSCDGHCFGQKAVPSPGVLHWRSEHPDLAHTVPWMVGSHRYRSKLD